MEPIKQTKLQAPLVEVLADQTTKRVAVLEKRLADNLAQQAATSQILRIIRESPGHVQPVFDTIANAALHLCSASSANVCTFDGQLLRMAAVASTQEGGAEMIRAAFPRRPGRETAAGRAVATGRVTSIPDVLLDNEYAITDTALAGGFRSAVAIPLLREGRSIGVIAVGKAEPGEFPERQIAMLGTFADQAVIAIENVRMFHELEARNRDVTDALARQTATSEILRIISGSPTDAQPVFDIIAERAAKLCEADVGVVSRVEGSLLPLAALYGVTREGVDAITRAYPMRADANTISARAVRSRAVIHDPDVLADPGYETKEAARAGGFRSGLGVPMTCEGEVIGAIFVGRSKPGLFSERQVELLKTFADQAVIAVQNVRLFNQLEARTQQLTRSVSELQALSEVGQAISSDARPRNGVDGDRYTGETADRHGRGIALRIRRDARAISPAHRRRPAGRAHGSAARDSNAQRRGCPWPHGRQP